MKVLVTGALGFLGCALVSALERQGHEVVAVGRAADMAAKAPIGFNELDLACGPAPIYNVGAGRATSLAEHVAKTIGRPAHVRREAARRVDLHRNVLDVALLARDIAWKPCVSLEEGIARLASHFSGVPRGDLDPPGPRRRRSAG